MISCAKRDTFGLFDRVEKCMDLHPDSALLLLNQLPHPENLQGKEAADYALLLTKARDKNYLDSMQSDSLIKIAVDYYKDGEDKVKKGEALFYYGKIMALQDSVTTAMQAYLEADSVLNGTIEYRMQGSLQEYIGYLNHTRFMYNAAVDNYLKSIYYNAKIKDTLRIAYGYRNIAHIYLAKQNNDSARWYTDCGINLLKRDSTLSIMSSLLQILGIIEKREGAYTNAIKYFQTAIKYEKKISTVDHYYFSLGDIYLQIGQFEKAKEAFEKGINSKQVFTQSGAYNYLSVLEKKRGDYAKALYYKEISDSLLYIAQDETSRNLILNIQRKGEKNKLIAEKKQIEQDKQIQLYFLLSVILLIIILSGSFFLLLKKIYRKRFRKNLRIIKENEQTIKNYMFRLEELNQKTKSTMKDDKEKFGKLNQKILLLTNENRAIRENICVNAVFLLDQLKKGTLIVGRMSKEEKSQIFEYIDLLFGNFMSRLKAEYELTENNMMLAALLKIGFTSKELMIVFDCEMNSVFKMKQRLKDRLHLSSESKLEEFLALY